MRWSSKWLSLEYGVARISGEGGSILAGRGRERGRERESCRQDASSCGGGAVALFFLARPHHTKPSSSFDTSPLHTLPPLSSPLVYCTITTRVSLETVPPFFCFRENQRRAAQPLPSPPSPFEPPRASAWPGPGAPNPPPRPPAPSIDPLDRPSASPPIGVADSFADPEEDDSTPQALSLKKAPRPPSVFFFRERYA